VSKGQIIREPMLDREGKPIRDPETGEILYKTISPVERKEPEVERKDPLDYVIKMKKAGLLDSPDYKALGEQIGKAIMTIKEDLKSTVEELKPKDLESEYLKELKDRVEKTEKEIEKEREARHEAEVQRLKDMKEKLTEDIKKLEQKLEERPSPGEPEIVSEIRERGKIGKEMASELREGIKEVVLPIVRPLTETMRSQYIMQLHFMEQAGQLPKGTVQKIVSPPEPSKSDVEKAKERLQKAMK